MNFFFDELTGITAICPFTMKLDNLRQRVIH
jgi:hypothetical protein